MNKLTNIDELIASEFKYIYGGFEAPSPSYVSIVVDTLTCVCTLKTWGYKKTFFGIAAAGAIYTLNTCSDKHTWNEFYTCTKDVANTELSKLLVHSTMTAVATYILLSHSRNFF